MIALYKGTAFWPSKVCEWLTWSPYSHASHVDDEEEMEIAAMACKGVKEITFLSAYPPGTVVDLFDAELTPGEIEGLAEFLYGEIGQPYDMRGNFGFLFRRKIEDPNAWFCSELIAAGHAKIKKPLLERIPSFQVYPGMIAYSPVLKFVKTITIGKEAAIEENRISVPRLRALGAL